MMPWDCRGTDPDIELEHACGARPSDGWGSGATHSKDHVLRSLQEEPPTSNIVKSYFNSAAGVAEKARSSQRSNSTPRHSHWEGNDAYSALYGPAAFQSQRSPMTPDFDSVEVPCDHPEATASGTFHQEEKVRLAALDQQIRKKRKGKRSFKEAPGPG
jgi:hypothetical protein